MKDNLALIEAGGTKFVVGIGGFDRQIRFRTRIETTFPEETISRVTDWLLGHGPIAATGIACFGPLDLDPDSPTWGYITRTTKQHWSMTDVAGAFGKALGCPVALDTDVNGAALAEWRWGAGQGAQSSLYLTVGTGIGGGAVVGGRLLGGLSHPEMGHLRLPRHPADHDFGGICPFHGDCLEGLASGPAITARWGASLSELAPDHEGHEIIAWYLARAISTFQAVLEPSRIILGGGVLETPGLLDRVRREAIAASGGYFVGDPGEIVVSPKLQNDAGLLGALALIEQNLPGVRGDHGTSGG
ncbi:ROK family protein [Allopontixanthobacter sp.]|uniref:ROK family protein n=1 Tax=Allopontixanthobacter sp. TaxID=2906452 RepID=UPI002AB99671|nr:ROK family protein [Allopontixanthobacter sp.]MDZ4307283.1 ROK family protein [Allopontixanthobacter sp.]